MRAIDIVSASTSARPSSAADPSRPCCAEPRRRERHAEQHDLKERAICSAARICSGLRSGSALARVGRLVAQPVHEQQDADDANGATNAGQSATRQARLEHERRDQHARKQHGVRAHDAGGERARRAPGDSRLRRENVSVTDVDDSTPPSVPASA